MSLPVFSSRFLLWQRLLAVVAVGFCVWLASPRAGAQVYNATTVGWPYIDLDSGWLVHAGDDPAYARADFDDSSWMPFNAATGSLRTLFSHSRPSIVWYRLHVKVPTGRHSLALYEYMISSACVVYVNGAPLIQVGKVAPFVPYDDHARLVVLIPRDQAATGSLVIAVRARISPGEWGDAQPGLVDWKLALGEDWGLEQHAWLQIIGEESVGWLNDCILLCLLLGALLLYSAQRERVEYLWLALADAAMLLPIPLQLYSLSHPFPAYWHIVNALSALAIPYLLGRMYLAFVAWPLGWRLHVFLVMTGTALAAVDLLRLRASLNVGMNFLLAVPFVLLTSVILPVILIVQFRKGKRDAGILLVPLLLGSLYTLVVWAGWLLSQIPSYRTSGWNVVMSMIHARVGPFAIDLGLIADILSSISLALIILLRTNRTSRQEALLESEVANARAVQQVLLPEHAEGVGGFEIESVYEPAQEVGGDFFQALPVGDGGLLVVVGDVAGKGLPAAMLVSMLVGAIRSTAAYTHNPVEVLAQLNERLLGRTAGGFSTALAVHIAADGALTMANAGHPAPYLDGREIELPGALPLGIDKGSRYETVQLRLAQGSRLTFYSDGVVEAQNARGELFGFDRGKALSTQPAAAVAAAAKQFGQLDDITVVAIRRTAAFALA